MACGGCSGAGGCGDGSARVAGVGWKRRVVRAVEQLVGERRNEWCYFPPRQLLGELAEMDSTDLARYLRELTDDELGYWDPSRSPQSVKRELRKLDVSGNLQRPLIIMHGTADPIVSPGESVGYQALVERVLGNEAAQDVLAVYYIPGMGHGGAQYDQVIDLQIDALEAWIDHRQSKGRAGAPAPAMIGAYPREPKSDGRHRNRFSGQENSR